LGSGCCEAFGGEGEQEVGVAGVEAVGFATGEVLGGVSEALEVVGGEVELVVAAEEVAGHVGGEVVEAAGPEVEGSEEGVGVGGVEDEVAGG